MKLVVCGKAIVITSNMLVKEIKRAAKICTEALILKDADSKKQIFAVSFEAGNKGNASGCGIQFDTETADGEAQLTIVCDKPVTKDMLTDEYGKVLLNLAKVETQFSTAYTAEVGQLEAAVNAAQGLE